jgi:hypothetical protein
MALSSGQKTIPKASLVWGLVFGTIFGFLLHRGGLTRYDVIIGQLLLKDFTMLKVMLSAVLVGMTGIYIMKQLKWVKLQPKPGSLGRNIIGGLIFGVGFALLGYCPGTIAAAVGAGALDALFGGITGIVIGAGMFAFMYGRLRDTILNKGYFGDMTLPRLLKVNDWAVVVPLAVVIVLCLLLLGQ